MSTDDFTPGEVRVTVENVGGIERQTYEFEPGVTVLSGENATNRTSTLRAIMAACGSDRSSLKADADEGAVDLDLGGERFSRTFERTSEGVRLDGSPIITDDNRVEAMDLFAFLMADNEARRAVVDPEQGLHDVVMGPVDTDDIEAEIDRIQSNLDATEEALDRRSTLEEDRIPSLEARRDDIEETLDELTAEIERIETELETADQDLSTSKAQQEQIDSLLSELGDARTKRERLDRRLDEEAEVLAEARSEGAEVETALADLTVPDEERRETLEAELEELRERRETLDEEVNRLTTVISFNEERLDGEGTIGEAIAAALGGTGATNGESTTVEELTGQLRADADGETPLRCWTCGKAAVETDIVETTDALRREVSDRQSTRRSVEADIEDVRDELESITKSRRRREELEGRVESIERTIADTQKRLESLTAQREEAVERVSDLEAELEDLETDDEAYDRVLELHGSRTELSAERSRTADELETVEGELKEAREELEELGGIEAKRDELEDQLRAQKRRISRLREEVVEGFNDHMDALLEKLDYANIERVWLECRQEEVTRGRRVVDETVFDLHVVRETDDGTVFEDVRGIEHLSESERNVVGLVFALSGYLAHEVYEDVPFMLLDSLEAIDARRIAILIEHFSEYAEFLVTTLLTEDSEPLVEDVEPETVIQVPSGSV